MKRVMERSREIWRERERERAKRRRLYEGEMERVAEGER